MYYEKNINIGTGVLLMAITLAILLMSIFGGQEDPKVIYRSADHGFSVAMERGFWETVTIREKNDGVYFYFRDIPKTGIDESMGLVGRIEVFPKEVITIDQMQELNEAYSLRLLGESSESFFAWSHASDIQINPGEPEAITVAFRAAEAEFESMISSFTLEN